MCVSPSRVARSHVASAGIALCSAVAVFAYRYGITSTQRRASSKMRERDAHLRKVQRLEAVVQGLCALLCIERLPCSSPDSGSLLSLCLVVLSRATRTCARCSASRRRCRDCVLCCAVCVFVFVVPLLYHSGSRSVFNY